MIPDLLTPFFTEVAAAALEAARKRGWHVVIYDTGGSVEEERGTLEIIASQVDAVVGYLTLPEDEIDKLIRGLPVVLIDRDHRAERFNAISIDGAAGVHDAIRHLVDAGHRRIGMLGHAARSGPSIRHRWYAAAMAAHGLESAAVSRAEQSIEGGEHALRELLTEHPDVTAVFTFNDTLPSEHCAPREGSVAGCPKTLRSSASTASSSAPSPNEPWPPSPWTPANSELSPSEQAGRLLARSGPLSHDEAAVKASLRLHDSA